MNIVILLSLVMNLTILKKQQRKVWRKAMDAEMETIEKNKLGSLWTCCKETK